MTKAMKLNQNIGDCAKSLELVLKQLKVERQAYHSLSFIGNHCHKLLKVNYQVPKRKLQSI